MSEPLLEIQDVKKHFSNKEGIFDRFIGKLTPLRAVDGLSFELRPGETFGLVGESGCGKSTLARTVLGLHSPTDGEIFYRGQPVSNLSSVERKELRQDIQFIFQDPLDSLNPRMTVGDSIAEPLVIHNRGDKESRKERVVELLNEVGLSPQDADKYPHQFSGGQQQRIGIARALALDPDLIIADEPVSSLDMSEQARILNLLRRLQEKKGISYLFIAHDLNVVRHICDRVGVMYLGKMMEVVSTDDLFQDVRHPYTHALLSAIPPADPDEQWNPVRLDETKIPDPVDPPAGCNFCTRCPVAEEQCFKEEPALEPPDPGMSRLSACFYPNWLEGEGRDVEQSGQ